MLSWKFFTFPLLLTVQLSWAQQPADILPPHAPFVVPVPSRAQWTITLDYGESKPAASADKQDKGAIAQENLQSIQTVKFDNLKRDILTLRNGKTSEVWYVGDKIILSPGPSGDVYVADSHSLDADNNVSGILLLIGHLSESFGFPGMDWVDLRYYDKVVPEGLVPCYHYILQGEGFEAAEAWVDVKTGLPVKYASNGITYTYAFGGEPSQLDMPPAYAAVYAKYRQMQAYNNQLMLDARRVMHP